MTFFRIRKSSRCYYDDAGHSNAPQEIRMRTTIICLVVAGILAAVVAAWATGMFAGESSDIAWDRAPSDDVAGPPPEGLERATFGGGCFWCTEAVFQQLRGVRSVVSGYSGGTIQFPTYEQVCTGTTGHAEVVQITFDPTEISYADLLEVFWQTHDPTTPNRQGNDQGPQYRSVIFYHSPAQRQLAEHYKQQLGARGALGAPIVTEISRYTGFYPAERYHQNYFVDHAGQRYCSVLIRPKVEKVRQVFKDRVKPAGS
jgi:peptide-methionine (S)-S-oxide reductase